jgi:hypothetical protein
MSDECGKKSITEKTILPSGKESEKMRKLFFGN